MSEDVADAFGAGSQRIACRSRAVHSQFQLPSRSFTAVNSTGGSAHSGDQSVAMSSGARSSRTRISRRP